jgi:outer membrane immunogenic protein
VRDWVFLPTNNLLLFATGGLAYGKVDEAANVGLSPNAPVFAVATAGLGFGFACVLGGPNCFPGSQSSTRAGWTAGAGAEYEFMHNLTFKMEYLYVNLGSNDFNLTALNSNGAPAPSFLKGSSSDAFNLVRAAINWRF